MKKILHLKLRFLAKLILLRYRPLVIGITGSIGKTSTREALSLVLGAKFRLAKTYKNYNNEVGLPLTIIGQKSPGKNIWAWFLVFFQAWKLIIFRQANYPEVLVLEMGADHPGDLKYLCSLAKPKIGVVTSVSYSHLEFFSSLEGVKKEKEILIKKLESKGLAILNYDNELSREMAQVSTTKVLTYGFLPKADLVAQDVKYNFDKGDYELTGINFKLNFRGSIVPVFMKNAISPGAVYAVLAATACGLELGLNLVDIAHSLSDFVLPRGRMNVLPGINHTFIIDDTYNSSPEACLSALDVLGKIKIGDAAKKYAVLGDMLEIGSFTKEGHRQVGEKVAKIGVNCLITVGEKSLDIAKAAVEHGLKDNYIFNFNKSEEAASFISSRLEPGDIVLVKGSQGMRMEKIVKEIMAERERASELIVRQGKEWL